MKLQYKFVLFVFVALALIVLADTGFSQSVSKPGVYSGYSTPLYTEWVRSSQYVTVRDGTKLAIDIFRPAVNGVAVNTPYPVVFQQTQYRRAYYRGIDPSYTGKSMADFLTKYGYVVAVGDPRGVGASYGTRGVSWDTQEAEDAHDLIEWLGTRSWSNGNVGMWGNSYMGGIQVLSASMKPPHLKAIFPAQTPFDQYDELYTIPERLGPMGELSNLVNDANSIPVDEDSSGVMLNEAVLQHKPHYDAIQAYAESVDPLAKAPYSQVGIAPYRDTVGPLSGTQYYYEASPSSYIAEIADSKVAVYSMGYWNNWLRRGSISAFSNFTNPSKLIMTASAMMPTFDFNMEHLRYFDYWLKGINNGIMDEPPVFYNVVSASAGNDWHFAWKWPLPNQKSVAFYLAAGPSNSSNPGTNDGALKTIGPSGQVEKDEYTVVYKTNLGLTYTTEPLSADTEVTGHPVMHLWISSDKDDGDFVVNLEEVDATTGKSAVISTGKLRASLRKLAEPPFSYMGLPWRRALKSDEQKLAGAPVELIFDLLPVSKVFKAGNRIRLNITCDSSPNTPVLSPAPVVKVYRNTAMASYISLPLISDPITVAVDVKPETLNLKSRGEFTVLITPSADLGKGYQAQDIDVSTLMCNGAPAIGGEVENNILVAKFKRQDLKNTSAGSSVTFKVTGKYYYDIPFAGSDKVRVNK